MFLPLKLMQIATRFFENEVQENADDAFRRDCQEIRQMPQTLKKEKERERENILGVENNRDEGRGARAERIRWFRVWEGVDDSCLLLLSGALAFPRVQCVSPPKEPAFSTYISAKVGAAFTHVASLVVIHRCIPRKNSEEDTESQTRNKKDKEKLLKSGNCGRYR